MSKLFSFVLKSYKILLQFEGINDHSILSAVIAHSKMCRTSLRDIHRTLCESRSLAGLLVSEIRLILSTLKSEIRLSSASVQPIGRFN